MKYSFNDIKKIKEIEIKHCLEFNGWGFEAGYTLAVLKNITDDYLEIGIINGNNEIVATNLIAKGEFLEIKTVDRVYQTITIS